MPTRLEMLQSCNAQNILGNHKPLTMDKSHFIFVMQWTGCLQKLTNHEYGLKRSMKPKILSFVCFSPANNSPMTTLLMQWSGKSKTFSKTLKQCSLVESCRQRINGATVYNTRIIHVDWNNSFFCSAPLEPTNLRPPHCARVRSGDVSFIYFFQL